MAKYVLSKNEDGELTGVCTKDYFDTYPDHFLDEEETAVFFEGPDNDGTDETWAKVKQLAQDCLSATPVFGR